MSYRVDWPHGRSLGKELPGNIEIKLGKAWDLVHGWCWMCRVWNWNDFKCFDGFSKNKFTAVRVAMKEASR